MEPATETSPDDQTASSPGPGSPGPGHDLDRTQLPAARGAVAPTPASRPARTQPLASPPLSAVRPSRTLTGLRNVSAAFSAAAVPPPTDRGAPRVSAGVDGPRHRRRSPHLAKLRMAAGDGEWQVHTAGDGFVCVPYDAVHGLTFQFAHPRLPPHAEPRAVPQGCQDPPPPVRRLPALVR
jgi:hypothetical protein